MKKKLPTYAVTVPKQAQKVFAGEIYDTYQWPQTMFDGSTATFEMLKRTDTVVIIAASSAKRILVLEETQPHSGSYITLPSGRVEEGEDIQKAAERELLEETGQTFRDWKLVGIEQPHPKIEHFVYILVAQDPSSTTSQQLDPGEKIIVKDMNFNDYIQLVKDGRVPLDIFTLRQIVKNPELTLSDILNLSEIK